MLSDSHSKTVDVGKPSMAVIKLKLPLGANFGVSSIMLFSLCFSSVGGGTISIPSIMEFLPGGGRTVADNG